MLLGFTVVRTFTIDRSEGRYIKAEGDSIFHHIIAKREVHWEEYEWYQNKKRECYPR